MTTAATDTRDPIEKVLNHLEGVKHLADGRWQALCPCHDDHRPSLSIKRGDDGTVLLKCRVGCETKAIVEQMGLRMCDLFPNKLASNGNLAHEIVETYDYKDADSKLIFQVCRRDDKQFPQRRPDGQDGWIWNLDDVPRVLYRLPELLAADPGAWVFIPEGEKDVDRLIAQGLVVTCNPGGAGKWKSVDDSPLHGRRIALIPDNDKAGLAHVEASAASLHGKAALVKVLGPLVKKKGGDVSDWLDAGGSADELVQLAEAAPLWKPSPNSATGRIAVGDSPRGLADFNLTEYGNCERLVHIHGDKLRYCHQTAQWYVWNRIRWLPDDTGAVMRLAKETLRQLVKVAWKLPHERKDSADRLITFAHNSERGSRLNKMIELARSERAIVVRAEELDADPWALNTLRGIIDLRTGKLRPHDPAELHTRLAPVVYDPDAICPVFDTFLDETTCGSEGLATYLQQTLGLCLTGDTSEQILPVYHGTGANGKNTLVDVIMAVLGDYAGLAAPDLLVAKQWTQHPTELADLYGKRLVVASETERHQRLRVQFVKQCTGDKRLKARFMRGNFFEFDRQFKVILVTNNRPIIDEQTHAIWRRIKLVPFTNVVPDEKQDKELPKKLLDEAPGVLAWLVRGCLSAQREGLITPGEVVTATADYQSESNWLERFIEECLNFIPGAWTRSSRLAEKFTQWRRDNGIEHSAVSQLYPYLRQEGCKQDKYQGNRGWMGVSLDIDATQPADTEYTT